MSIKARPRLNMIVGTGIINRYSKYDNRSIDIFFEIILKTRHIKRISTSSVMKSLRIPNVLPATYSRFEMDRVYRTSLVSSFLSRLRKSAARKITTIACPMFNRYRLIRGIDEEIAMISQGCPPIGEKSPIFMKVRITSAPIEKSLKNQLRLNVLASYRATVDILCRNAIQV
jgi:hypothetical protein